MDTNPKPKQASGLQSRNYAGCVWIIISILVLLVGVIAFRLVHSSFEGKQYVGPGLHPEGFAQIIPSLLILGGGVALILGIANLFMELPHIIKTSLGEREARRKLKKKGELTTEQLCKMLLDEDQYIRMAAIQKLRMVEDASTKPYIENALMDSYFGVREIAAKILANIGDSESVEPLSNAIKDPDDEVDRAIIAALGSIGDKRAIKPLSKIFLEDSEFSRRRNAASALVQINGDDVSSVFINALKHGMKITKSDYDKYDVIKTSIRMLGKLKERKAVVPLIEIVQGYEISLKISAVNALGEIGDEKALESLLKFKKYPDDQVRSAASLAIKKIPTRIRLTRDKKENEVEAIASSLEDKPKKKSSRGVWIVLIVLVLIPIVCCTVCLIIEVIRKLYEIGF